MGGDGSGLYKSTDNGDHWEATSSYSEYYWSTSFVNNNIGIIIAQIFVAEVPGDEGHLESFGFQSDLLNQIQIVFLIFDTNYIYAGAGGNDVRRSTDNGQNWQSINNGIPGNTSVRAMVVDSNSYLYAATGDSGIYRSVDHGERWSPLNSGLTNLKVTCLIY